MTMRLGRPVIAAAALLAAASPAMGECHVRSVSVAAISLGSYAAQSGATQARALTVTVGFSGEANECRTAGLRLALRRATLPALMSGPSGSTLRYDLANDARQSVLYIGSPGATIPLSVSQPPSRHNGTFVLTGTVVATAVAGQTQAVNGPYGDGGVLGVLLNGSSRSLNGTGTAINVEGVVNSPRSCTIGGSPTPAAGMATIPITPTGRVASTAPIAPSFPGGAHVACTGAGIVTLSLSSQNRRLIGPPSIDASFANAIDYEATVNVAGGTAATYRSTTGLATAGTTGGVSGNLNVSIVPIDPGKPLLAGSYRDMLTITVMPH